MSFLHELDELLHVYNGMIFTIATLLKLKEKVKKRERQEKSTGIYNFLKKKVSEKATQKWKNIGYFIVSLSDTS